MDVPLRAALEQIGELWRHDRAGIFLEHRAVQICLRALTELRASIAVPATAPGAVGGAVASDPYLLPSMAAALVLAGEGFETVDLGADLPLESLGEAMERLGARLVWISASVATDGRVLAADVAHLVARAAARSAQVMIGGRGASALVAGTAPNLFVGGSMSELAAFARGLRASAG